MALSPLLPWHQEPPHLTPVGEAKNPYGLVQLLDARDLSVEAELARIRDTQLILTGRYTNWINDVAEFNGVLQSRLRNKENIEIENKAAMLGANGNELLTSISDLGILLPLLGMMPTSSLITISSKILLMKPDQKQADNTVFLEQDIRSLS